MRARDEEARGTELGIAVQAGDHRLGSAVAGEVCVCLDLHAGENLIRDGAGGGEEPVGLICILEEPDISGCCRLACDGDEVDQLVSVVAVDVAE